MKKQEIINRYNKIMWHKQEYKSEFRKVKTIFNNFLYKLNSDTKDLDSKIVHVVNDNLWNLL